MEYRRLGKSGLKVSELSFGSWVTFGSSLSQDLAKSCMREAFEHGVNFFDNAEVYAKGESERLMGQALKDFRREELVISTKIFWGGDSPNERGLSWKHLVEGTKNSLKRLDLEYVDLLFCHRPDPETPIEESVRAMDYLIRSGYAFYWGTSEWSADEITEAFEIAERCNCIPPTMEQPQYNLLVRDRVEREYARLYEERGLGTTIWSPLASGFLTGKYSFDGAEKSTERASWVEKHLSTENHKRMHKLKKIADELGCTLAQLAIAWCLIFDGVSTVITGASSVEQVRENMKSLEVKSKFTPEILRSIDELFPVGV